MKFMVSTIGVNRQKISVIKVNSGKLMLLDSNASTFVLTGETPRIRRHARTDGPVVHPISSSFIGRFLEVHHKTSNSITLSEFTVNCVKSACQMVELAALKCLMMKSPPLFRGSCQRYSESTSKRSSG